jgi:hypothetical protein
MANLRRVEHQEALRRALADAPNSAGVNNTPEPKARGNQTTVDFNQAPKRGGSFSN